MTKMARPRKQRYYEDVQLEDNLYPDNRGRYCHWRYKRPDGTFKHFTANTVQDANAIAAYTNQRRDTYVSTRQPDVFGTLAHYVDEYIRYREEQSVDLKSKRSWHNRCYALRQFTRTITLPVSQIDRPDIQAWWDTLSNHQQKQRHAEFRKFFNYLMGRSLLPRLQYNPFTTADDRPRLYTKSLPARRSQRLTRTGFWRIYACAGELGYTCLQVAMGISLLTFMREGDICDLRLDEDIEENLLKCVIGKSAAQKGSVNAARLKWDLANYNLLRQLLNHARELSLQNRRCPFVISHWPKQKRMGKTKEHVAQVTPRRLIAMFDEARRMAGFTGPNPPVFHGVRSLADKLATDAGYNIKTIQHAMAHASEDMTRKYLDGHELPYEHVEVKFTEQDIGGGFS